MHTQQIKLHVPPPASFDKISIESRFFIVTVTLLLLVVLVLLKKCGCVITAVAAAIYYL